MYPTTSDEMWSAAQRGDRVSFDRLFAAHMDYARAVGSAEGFDRGVLAVTPKPVAAPKDVG